MKVILIILGVLVLAGLIFLGYKLLQLKKLKSMSVEDMLSYVTEDEGTYVSFALIEDGKVTYHTYGSDSQETEETAFDYEIGSNSKTMAALLISKAIEEGKLSLSDSISKYLELPEGKYYPTIERLLTHTSGYHGFYLTTEMIGNGLHKDNSFYGVSKEKMLKKVSSINLKDKDYPFKYSNFGISVLGLVLEQIYQKDYSELLTEYLQNELCLTHSSVAGCRGNLSGYWKWNKNDAYVPAGAVISNIYDMSRYVTFVMESEEAYVQNTLHVIKPVKYKNVMYENMGIEMNELCMTWIHDNKHDFVFHAGGTSNYNSYIAISDDKTKAVVLLSNYGPDKKIPVIVIGAKIMEEGFEP